MKLDEPGVEFVLGGGELTGLSNGRAPDATRSLHVRDQENRETIREFAPPGRFRAEG